MGTMHSRPAGSDSSNPNSNANGTAPDWRKRLAKSVEGEVNQERCDTPIRVLIADDHVFVRQGLRTVLSARPGDFEICAEAETGLEAVEKARQSHPDVAVIDVSMPGLNGLEATRMILKDLPRTEVLILTMHESEQLIEGLLNAGARGYLLKTDVARDLPVAIESLYKQRPFFSSKIARGVLDGYLKAASKKQWSLDADSRRAPHCAASGGRQEQQGSGECPQYLGEDSGDASRQHHAQARHALHERPGALRC